MSAINLGRTPWVLPNREECNNQNTTVDDDETAALDDDPAQGRPAWSATVSAKNSETTEVSPYYRRDRREEMRGVPPPGNVTGLRSLLKQRYEARKRLSIVRQTGEGGGGLGVFAAQDEVAIVDRQLREWHGVVVYDSPPIWTTTTKPKRTTTTTPSDRCDIDDINIDECNLPEEPVGQRRKREERAMRRLVELHGPLGHPYQPLSDSPTSTSSLDPLFVGLDVPTMHRLLSKRERLRLEGRYEEADAVKLELWIQGIRVSDATKRWAPARSRSRQPEEGRREPSNHDDDVSTSPLRNVDNANDEATAQTYMYTEDVKRSVGFPNANHAGGGSPQQQQQQQQEFLLRRRVEQLLGCRLRAMARGDTRTTLYLDLELHRTYRVRVDDKRRVWWVVAPSAEEGGKCDAALVEALRRLVAREEEAAASPPASVIPLVMLRDDDELNPTEARYHWSAGSMGLEHGELFRSRVDTLVRHRAWKREEGKFLEADAIRRELWCTYVRLSRAPALSNSGPRESLVPKAFGNVRAPPPCLILFLLLFAECRHHGSITSMQRGRHLRRGCLSSESPSGAIR